MALTSTLGSPGIEIREVDNSYHLDSSTTTTIYVPGFAAQGPVEQVISISSIADFETIYGTPTNAAERYFYYTVKAILDGSGSGTNILCSRLPYGSGQGDTVTNAYTLLAYPAIPVIKKKYNFSDTTDEDKTEIKTSSFDFDQFIFTTEETIKLNENQQTVVLALSKETEKENINKIFSIVDSEETINPSSYTYSFAIDGDLDKDVESISSIGLSQGKQLPEISSLIDLNNIESSDNKAPKMQFSLNGVTCDATGIIATELVNDEDYIVHLSYTLYAAKITDNVTPEKIGSFYISLSFKKDSITKNINSYSLVQSDETINATKIKAFDVAASYQGQSKQQEEAGDEKTSNFSEDVTYLIGSPVTFQISLNEYYKIITGESLKWSRRPYTFNQPEIEDGIIKNDYNVKENSNDTTGSPSLFGLYDAIGHSAFILINTSRSIINNNFEGYYVGITDNMFVNPSDDYTYNAVDSVKITTRYYDSSSDLIGLMDNSLDLGDFQTLSTNRLSFYLNSNYQGSISRILTRNITSMDISGTDYDDTISLGLFKLSKSATSSDILKLNYTLREKYNWSFGKSRVKSSISSTIPVSYFAENIMENSSNISILINPFISNKSFVDTNGVVHGKMRIYGTKLVDNLDKFEKKYLLRSYTNSIPNTKEGTKISAVVPARVADSSIASWKSIVSQAGVSPEFIKTNLSYDTQATDESEYYSFQPINSIIPFGTYTSATNTNKIIGSLPVKLQRALELVENDEEYPDIDLIVESGLGTIYMNSSDNEISSESAFDTLLIEEQNNTPISGEDNNKSNVFDENIILTGVEDLRTGRSSLSDDAQKVIEDYRAIQDVFTQFANSMQNGGRGDCFYISDVPRGILLKGKNTKVTNLFGTTIESNAYDFGESVNHSFPTSVYYPIKHTFDTIVSSYMSTYAQWVKVLDNFSGEKVWIPVSGYIAANMASTDGTYGPWYAAAGLRRGVINGVLDYALSPNVSQRTDLYKLCINSVPKIPRYGVTIWGIRTMSKAASAFDQNTCRRTFLYMEKKVKQTLRYYIFEPNTSYTRLQIVNEIDPFLEKVKNAGGIYSYTLICDTSNNTPDVINNGDLAVSIAAAPTRTAENIVVEFTANKYTEEVSAAESMN